MTLLIIVLIFLSNFYNGWITNILLKNEISRRFKYQADSVALLKLVKRHFDYNANLRSGVLFKDGNFYSFQENKKLVEFGDFNKILVSKSYQFRQSTFFLKEFRLRDKRWVVLYSDKSPEELCVLFDDGSVTFFELDRPLLCKEHNIMKSLYELKEVSKLKSIIVYDETQALFGDDAGSDHSAK